MISEIVKIINSQLSGIREDESIFGIARTIEFQSGTSQIRMPGITNASGEIKYVGIDDVHSLVIYHKLNSITIGQLKNGHGDAVGDTRNTALMSMYVYWDTLKLILDIGQLSMLLQSRTPLLIKGLTDIKSALISQSNINTNTIQLYNQEYSVDKMLPENKQIFQLNYTIEIIFNSQCFRQCPECN